MSIRIDKGWQYLLYFVDCLVSLHEFLERRGHRFTVTYLNVTLLVNRCVIFLPNFLFNRSKYDVCMDGWVLLYFCDTWHGVLGRLPASSRPRHLGFRTLAVLPKCLTSTSVVLPNCPTRLWQYCQGIWTLPLVPKCLDPESSLSESVHTPLGKLVCEHE